MHCKAALELLWPGRQTWHLHSSTNSSVNSAGVQWWMWTKKQCTIYNPQSLMWHFHVTSPHPVHWNNAEEKLQTRSAAPATPDFSPSISTNVSSRASAWKIFRKSLDKHNLFTPQRNFTAHGVLLGEISFISHLVIIISQLLYMFIFLYSYIATAVFSRYPLSAVNYTLNCPKLVNIVNANSTVKQS